MEDYLSQLWNGYIEGETEISGADLSKNIGSPYPYTNASIR